MPAATPYGVKPSNLAAQPGAPAPTPDAAPIKMSAPAPTAQPQASAQPQDDIEAYGQYLLEHGQKPEEVQQYVAYLRSHPEAAGAAAQPGAPAPDEEPQSFAGKALDTAGRVLDYPGGFARAGVAQTVGQFAGKPNLVTEADIKNIVKGKGPNSEEYLKRLGVSEGWKSEMVNNLTGMNITGRAAEGFLLDVATDPLTMVAKLVREVPYVKSLLNAPGQASEALGEAAYKSGLKKVDAKLVEKGGAPVSDVLLSQGAQDASQIPAGSTAKIMQEAQNMSSVMGKVRQGMYDRANQLGLKINMAEKEFPATEAVLERLGGNRGMQAAHQELEGLLNSYKNGAPVSIDLVSDWKTDLRDALPGSAFDQNAKLKGYANRFKQALAADFKNIIVSSGNTAEKGLGDSINAVNEKWGPLLNSMKPMAQQAKQAGGKSLGSWVDGVLLSSGHPGLAATKKAFELADTTYARTKVGKALLQAGQSGVATGTANRILIDSGSAPPEEQP